MHTGRYSVKRGDWGMPSSSSRRFSNISTSMEASSRNGFITRKISFSSPWPSNPRIRPRLPRQRREVGQLVRDLRSLTVIAGKNCGHFPPRYTGLFAGRYMIAIVAQLLLKKKEDEGPGHIIHRHDVFAGVQASRHATRQIERAKKPENARRWSAA